MKCPNFLLAVALASAAAPSANAESVHDLMEGFRHTLSTGSPRHQLSIDNDSLLLRKDDGLYTSGLRYTHSHAKRTAARLRVAGWHVGQELYTASDIKRRPDRIWAQDHPYAAWLYGGVFSHAYRANGSFTKLGLDLGCLGPCAGGEWSQENLHRLFNQPRPKGWDTQLGTEVGVVLHGEVAPARWKLSRTVDLSPHVFWRFGNIFTDGGAGVTLRAGQLSQYPDQPAFYAFLRADARAVGYNATLQGGYFADENARTVKPKRAVGEVEIGVNWRQGPYDVQASIVRRGNEIEGLPNAVGEQSFVRVNLLYAY